MRLDIGLLADAATEKFGQLNILGTFDTIHAPGYPVTHPHCSLVLRIAAHPTETGEHTFRIVLRDSDGRTVKNPQGQELQIDGGLTIGPSRAGTWVEPTVPIVVGFGGLYIPAPDTYTFSVLVDGRHLGDVRFHAVVAAQQAA